MNVDGKKKFGFCRGCHKWKPRDGMVSANIRIYGEGVDNTVDRIQIRLCSKCHEGQKAVWFDLEWEPTLIEARHIRVNEELAGQCDEIDYDDSQEAMLEAANEG